MAVVGSYGNGGAVISLREASQLSSKATVLLKESEAIKCREIFERYSSHHPKGLKGLISKEQAEAFNCFAKFVFDNQELNATEEAKITRRFYGRFLKESVISQVAYELISRLDMDYRQGRVPAPDKKRCMEVFDWVISSGTSGMSDPKSQASFAKFIKSIFSRRDSVVSPKVRDCAKFIEKEIDVLKQSLKAPREVIQEEVPPQVTATVAPPPLVVDPDLLPYVELVATKFPDADKQHIAKCFSEDILPAFGGDKKYLSSVMSIVAEELKLEDIGCGYGYREGEWPSSCKEISTLHSLGLQTILRLNFGSKTPFNKQKKRVSFKDSRLIFGGVADYLLIFFKTRKPFFTEPKNYEYGINEKAKPDVFPLKFTEW